MRASRVEITMRIMFITLFFGILYGCGLTSPLLISDETKVRPDQRFNFDHVRKSLLYFSNPTESNLRKVAATDATIHLLRHGRITGRLTPKTTAMSLTRVLLEDSGKDELVEEVTQQVHIFRRDKASAAQCLREAEAYLPQSLPADGKLFFTWGFDIGVASGKDASINLAHKKFQSNPEEVWFYCIHELHHTGVMQHHPMPMLSDVNTTTELFAILQYFTFLEGTAVYAAHDARKVSGALDKDSDYVALTDADTILEFRHF